MNGDCPCIESLLNFINKKNNNIFIQTNQLINSLILNTCKNLELYFLSISNS